MTDPYDPRKAIDSLRSETAAHAAQLDGIVKALEGRIVRLAELVRASHVEKGLEPDELRIAASVHPSETIVGHWIGSKLYEIRSVGSDYQSAAVHKHVGILVLTADPNEAAVVKWGRKRPGGRNRR